MSVKRSNLTLAFFKATCHVNQKRTVSSSYISRHIFRKFSNTSVSNNEHTFHDMLMLF